MRYYLDLKKGLKLYEVIAPNIIKQAMGKYWLEVLQTVDIKQPCWSSKYPTCSNKNECTCQVVAGLGDKILDKMINDVLPNKSSYELSQAVDPLLKAEWERIGEIIVAWCCASTFIEYTLLLE